ncbi:hypothetical protein ACP4OV_009189 [Aristida adscensionis]
MLNLYPRMPVTMRTLGGDRGDHGDGDGDGGYNPFYGITVVCISIFIFCVLAATVSVWKALAFAVLAALPLAAVGCFWFRGTSPRPASTELVFVTVTDTGAAAPRARALRARLADTPPAFAFKSPPERDGGGGEPTAGAVVCPVCLEDVRGGDMVRQVPACRHIFHVECIDMWLHAHWTCPMCRCEISPATPNVAPKAAPPETQPGSSADELPPV